MCIFADSFDGLIFNLNFQGMSSESLVLFFIIAVVLVGGAVLFSTFIAPSSSLSPAKFEPYECGIPVHSPAWIQFNVGYYLYAIIFLVFDVETVFIFPWGVVMREVGLRAFIEILIFFVVLGLGLLYAWRKKALKWA
jgi:NADH:ubiquinone oxidoreductase subunit 3 (subunit A)